MKHSQKLSILSKTCKSGFNYYKTAQELIPEAKKIKDNFYIAITLKKLVA
tara:strand:- start:318 stop:467 length:150 start_codon:yes stop_codon:yes gene_type:complete